MFPAGPLLGLLIRQGMAQRLGKRTLEDHTLAVCELCRSTRFLAAARDFEADLRSIDAREKHAKAVILSHIIFRVSLDVDL